MRFRSLALDRTEPAFFAVRFLTAGLDRGCLYWQEELSRAPSLEFLWALRRRFPCSSRARLHHC